jgi:hypothetical protein
VGLVFVGKKDTVAIAGSRVSAALVFAFGGSRFGFGPFLLPSQGFS